MSTLPHIFGEGAHPSKDKYSSICEQNEVTEHARKLGENIAAFLSGKGA
ncbi:hypothetical protein MFMK1_001922 [Metallumcola ferriviriculae]|uniref:Uncharacterized protein n=1 Tax=Metallumcola ferriviriculae TaxID=3039180 RepID=A0AAU0UQH4_9FIRM|nr:hypothetical protein MFMK1_001922 [Desulfitibacteraceae bacterium MK1]